jgi:hypothetical protein
MKKLFRHYHRLFPDCASLQYVSRHSTLSYNYYHCHSILLNTQHHQISQAESIVFSSLHNYSKLLKLHHTTINMPAQRPSQLPPCPGPPPSRPLPPLPKQG